MRRIALLALLVPSFAIAAPGQFVLQGRLLDTDGVAANGPHDLTVTLYRGNGESAWQRTFDDTPFSAGYFAVTLDTDDSNVPLAAVTRGADPVVELGMALDQGAEQQPRQPFFSAPFAEVASAVPASASLAGTACTGLGSVAFDISQDALVACTSAGVWTNVGGCGPGTVAFEAECVPCGRAAIEQAGPLYYWPLDDASGNAVVDVTGRDDGVYLGSVTRSSDTPVYGSSGVTLPGLTSTYMRFEAFTPPVGDTTVMGWVRTSTGSAGIVSYATPSQQNEWLPLHSPSGMVYYVKGTSRALGDSIDDGSWHHVATSRVEATGEVVLYVDGQPTGGATVVAGQSPDGSGIMVFGQEQDTYGGGFEANQALDGGMDDIAMFSRVLDATEIQRIYHGQLCQ